MSELRFGLPVQDPAMRRQMIDDLRRAMLTLPQDRPPKQTTFYRGVENIIVRLVDWPVNPYKAIFTITTATWGNVWQLGKWRACSPDARFYVVLACLSGKSLPNGMEAPSFTFEIAGLSRSAYDQIARLRLGAVIGSMGIRDNNHSDIDYRIPEGVWRQEPAREAMIVQLLAAKDAYVDALERGQAHWQDARAVMPMSACHRFALAINYAALRGFMGKRLMACEQADTVATAWLMRERIHERWPLLAAFLRPSCDGVRRCTYHDDSTLSEAFGCLFRGCGRWPEATDEYATFNESCSDYATMAQQAGFTYFPGDVKLVPDQYEQLAPQDKLLFELAD